MVPTQEPCRLPIIPLPAGGKPTLFVIDSLCIQKKMSAM